LGAWLGVVVVGSIATVPAVPGETSVDPAWLWLFMPLVFVALAIIFQTTRRDFVWVVIGCAVAYAGMVLGSSLANDNLGTVLGTTLAVLYANLWARWTDRPETIALLPAIVVLVSGSIGFRGLAAIAQGQTAVGTQQFVQMFVVALAIAAGLLIANTIVRPRVSL
ncbi:MAG: threonine/serine exporter family protein, partial [Chloroflexota bacterium]